MELPGADIVYMSEERLRNLEEMKSWNMIVLRDHIRVFRASCFSKHLEWNVFWNHHRTYILRDDNKGLPKSKNSSFSWLHPIQISCFMAKWCASVQCFPWIPWKNSMSFHGPIKTNLPFFIKVSSVWWLTYPSEKYECVNWNDEIPNWMGK